VKATSAQLAVVAGRLRRAGCVAAEEEAADLVAAAADEAALDEWLARRERGEPPAWIIGHSVFAGRRIRVDQGVFVPRAQSEELARRAGRALPAGGWAIDFCTGTGAIAAYLSAARRGARVIGVDRDLAAARCAGSNGVSVFVGDLDAAIAPAVNRVFDVVTAVPPYVPSGEIAYLPVDVRDHEPLRALDGGADGLRVSRRVVAAGSRLLRAGGYLFLEAGGDQEPVLQECLKDAGFAAISSWHDEDGDLRGMEARLLR
jgi:release factor glutamine methyltransferase